MSWMPIGADEWARGTSLSEVGSPGARATRRLLVAGVVLRTLFIVSLLIVTVHVSMPQSASIWTAYETPGDLIRMALGS